MQMSLAQSAMRCRPGDPEAADCVLRGQLDDAVRLSVQRLGRQPRLPDASGRSLQGQLLVRTLLALGREQEAEEVAQELRRSYDEVSRAWVRWCTALDQGWLFLSQNRPGRAIECFRSVTEDADAPADLMLEAHGCLADALAALGEVQKALGAIEQARRLCDQESLAPMRPLVECHRLELIVLQVARRAEELADHALAGGFRGATTQGDPAALRRELAALETSFAEQPLVAQRLQHLQMTMTAVLGGSEQARFSECIAWLKERRLAGLEQNARIESAMALLAGGSMHAAGELLGAVASSEAQARQSRYSIDVQYCRSKLLLNQGQAGDAMRAYKHHVEQAVYVLRRDFAQVQSVRLADARTPGSHEDANRLRLPLKYRAAYQYIVEHLAEPALSVRDVAAHLGVTERSLQIAFRAHLGMTPAEFIRKRRMERIRDDLEASTALRTRVNVLDVAARWGVSNRSTLAQNYRQVYAETPFQTLHGKQRTEAER